MRYPEFLKENGTIGFVAPSFGCSTEPYRTAFNHALDKWKKEGYGIDIGPNCYENSGVGISNTPEKCAEELTEWYCRKENDILISCGGGELMCEVLPFVDFERIRKGRSQVVSGIFRQYQYDLSSDNALRHGGCLWTLRSFLWHGAATSVHKRHLRHAQGKKAFI